MPKPRYGVPGSGMHINMSLSKEGKNIFFDAEDPMELSQEARYFIGGLIKHIKGMSIITNPLVNSYKRLVPGYEAPVGIAWSSINRSPLIRIPSTKGEGTRVELRNPDPAANPYLAFAVCLAAGLDGIENQIEPPQAISGNVFELEAKERERLGIELLPTSLKEAVEEFEKDEFVQGVLGTHASQKYLDAKRAEWIQYTTQVTSWEIDEYLYKI